ncbi:MAG: MFS transporter [Paraclostridium sp.]
MNLKDTINTYRGLPKEIYVLFIGKIINCIGAFVHPLMTLILTQKVGMTNTEAGKLVTLLAICQVPSLIIGGKLADTIGRRKVIIIFQLLGAITLFSCGFIQPSKNMAYLMIISSCLYSLSTPAYDALNADLTNSNNRKSAYSLLYMGVNIGFAIGPVIGGLLYNKYLPIIFIGDAITTLISLTLFTLFIKETKGNKEAKKIEKENLEHSEQGSAIKVLLQRPILICFSLILLTYHFGYSQIGFALPLQLNEVFGGDGARLYGLIGGFNGFVVILLTPILTSMTKKTDAIKVMGIGGIFYAIAFGLYGIVLKESLFFMAMLIMTVGEILVSINQGAFVASKTPASHRGRVSSILPLISGAGYALGPIIMGNIIDSFGMFNGWMLVCVVVVIGSGFMFSLIAIDKKTATNKEEAIKL